MKNGRPQLKDLPSDVEMLRIMDSFGRSRCRWSKHELVRGFPEKLLYAKAMRMVDRGLIDYGVSVWRPWLTNKGSDRLLGVTR